MNNITKITVFGASGATGQHVVTQALKRGFVITAFVRDPEKLKLQHVNLRVVRGDVLNMNEVNEAVAGTDAIIVTLGSKPDTKVTVLSEGTGNIIKTMREHGVTRLVVLSSYPMSGTLESMEFLKKIMPEEKIAQVRPMIDDKIGQEKVVRESGMMWTIVRPAFLTDDPKTGEYRAEEKLEITPVNKISRADVADFLLTSLSNPSWYQKIVTLAY